ncbi:MAG: bifunctional homocysteine S-methyltransferase/methylenetetrahydrofolate reductase [Lachnospiraceae bacterium]|nr:bifunctional homocysteine S-methyltransferase/methylenetetrahydrofolate reductase [Lachnospiraceae bacterium]
MTIQDYIKEHKILAQGAMGTYYSIKSQREEEMSEIANLSSPQKIQEIHEEYIEAGANLLITNTFSANTVSLQREWGIVEECIRKGIQIARDAISNKKNNSQELFLAGDIGPIPENGERTREENLSEYKKICDIFIEEKLPVILFETFPEISYIKELATYIKEKDSNIFLITNLCVNKNGYTLAGMNGKRLLEELAGIKEIDVCGLNCGVGSGHIYQLILEMQELLKNKYIMVAPNAGYPEQLQNRMVFFNNASYFAENMKKMSEMNLAILGGCCGTTPKHIELLRRKMDDTPAHIEKNKTKDESILKERAVTVKKNTFLEKLQSGKKVVAVELDPPYDGNDGKIMECAHILGNMNVDMITIADSPMGRSRVDSLLMSVKIANETGMPVMPHLSCRDKNMIAMRSGIIGGYVNKIRNLLLVTGDPVPSEQRKATTSVFDYHSIRLMEFVKEMNQEHFAEEPIVYGGALNYGRGKIENVIARMEKKIQAGASYFLTQPIYAKEDIERIRQIKECVDTKILCGIMPLVSYRNANFIKNEMTGIHVPDEIVERYTPDMSKEEAEWVGAKIASEIIEKLSPYADGYYFMLPFNRVSLMEKIEIK